ncbi:hypothetical protein IAR50_007316 [Cryptococcus sp. DSM 104548]
MGSSQSQPARTPAADSPTIRRRSNIPLSSIRRLSTLGRRGASPVASASTSHGEGEAMEVERTASSGGGKRSRQGSSTEGHVKETERKKARVGEAEVDTGGDVYMADASEYSTPQPAEPYPQPHLTPPISTASSFHMSPTASNDSLTEERVSTLNTIRSALGPDWPPSDTPEAVEVERLTRRHAAARAGEPSAFSSGPSQPPPAPSLNGNESVLRTHDGTDPHVAEARASLQRATAQAQLLADRIATLSQQLNRVPSPPSSRPSSSSSRPASISQAPTADPAPAVGSSREGMMRHLHRRLNDARSQLRDTERQLNATRERLDTGGTRRRRVPTGAVLVIQGLAQTQGVGEEPLPETSAAVDEDVPLRGDATSDDGEAQPRPRARRASEGDSRRPSGSGSREEIQDASLESQARMIGGLLTVAAAATATTLLAPGGNRPSLASALAPPRPSPSSTLESLLNRIRPNRQGAAERQEREDRERERAQSVEASLGTYLRNVLRDNREGSSTSASSSPSMPPNSLNSPAQTYGSSTSETTATTAAADERAEEAEEAISSGFQRFLEDLQADLAVAVRDFAGPLPVAPAGATDGETSQETTGTSGGEDQERTDSASSANPGNPTATSSSSNPPVPSFHPQLAQNRASTPSSTRPTAPQAVTGGYDGVPRRMNFFRAHMFPAIDAYTARAVEGPLGVDNGAQAGGEERGETSASAAADPPHAPQDAPAEAQAESANDSQRHPPPAPLIPTIFIGVRNIRHDATMSTEDLVSHPNFPFVNGEVPARDLSVDAEAGSSLREEGPNGEQVVEESAGREEEIEGGRETERQTRASSAPPARPSLRERIFSHLRRPPIIPVSSSSNATAPTGSSTAPTINTYLIYIIGANYPPGHPILRMPSLVHGGEMSDEELRLVGEILGPVKAPTVGKGDIEKSGLRVVKGGDMEKEGEQGRVLESCAERCLVCLSDYEPDDNCRILACRHAFHQECVDHWLTQGRNSCPACRAEAVETKPSWSIGDAAATQGQTVPAATGTSSSTTMGSTALDELD